MDYNGGSFLAHYQWRVMQDSVMFVWGLFQDDEDGMAGSVRHYIVFASNAYEKTSKDKYVRDATTKKNKYLPVGSEVTTSAIFGNAEVTFVSFVADETKNPYKYEVGKKCYTEFKNLREIYESKEKYLTLSKLESSNIFELPYSESSVSGASFEKNFTIESDFKCGDFIRVKDPTSVNGHIGKWINLKDLLHIEYYAVVEENAFERDKNGKKLRGTLPKGSLWQKLSGEKNCKLSKIDDTQTQETYTNIINLGRIYFFDNPVTKTLLSDVESKDIVEAPYSAQQFEVEKSVLDNLKKGKSFRYIAVCGQYVLLEGTVKEGSIAKGAWINSKLFFEITSEQIKNIFGNDISDERANTLAPLLNKWAEFYGINTPERMSCFLGQAFHETSLKPKSEIKYQTVRMVEVFCSDKNFNCNVGHLFNVEEWNEKDKKYVLSDKYSYDETKCNGKKVDVGNSKFNECYKTAESVRIDFSAKRDVEYIYQTQDKTGKDISTKVMKYGKGKSNLYNLRISTPTYNDGILKVKDKYNHKLAQFDVLYGCRLGNGAINTGDGSRYRGRGMIQATGLDAYKDLENDWPNLDSSNKTKKKFVGVDDEASKNRALLDNDYEAALLSALIWWKNKKTNEVIYGTCDYETIYNTSKKVGGRLDSYCDRREQIEKAYNVLK
jgi:predicted chitinase